MEDNNDPANIAVPKPRICTKLSKHLFKPVCVSSVLKRAKDKLPMKPCDSATRKFYLPCDKPPMALFKREELLLSYKAYSKAQKNDERKQKLAINLIDRYKVVTTNLKKRLYVEDPEDDVLAVTDVNEHFFNCVNGRPLPYRDPLFKSLKTAAADLLRIKQEIGYRYEAFLNIEANKKLEMKIYSLSLKRCTEQAKYFDSFISEDYRKSMTFLENWEKLKLKLYNKVSEMENLAAIEFSITSRLMSLDYLYGLQQKYGRFLYYLSPPSWRANHKEFALSVEIEAKGFDLGNNSEDDTFDVLFAKMQKECCIKFVKPVIYFSHPYELLEIFDGIEKQQLHHFAYITHLAPPKKLLKEGIKCLKDIIAQESAYVANTIGGLIKLLDFNNERCVELETRFYKILYGLFYETVGAPEVLKLFLHLEFCYERVHADKAFNMDIVTIAKALEGYWIDYSQRLDAIHSGTVKQSVVQCMMFERLKMRRARLAARDLRDFERLERDLLRSHFYPKTDKFRLNLGRLAQVKKAVPRKSFKREYSKADIKINQHKQINEPELEYLTLFTDWTEGEDPTEYLHRLEDEE